MTTETRDDMTMQPNPVTMPPGYEVMGPPFARIAALHLPPNGEYFLVVDARPGGMTLWDAASACREHYQRDRAESVTGGASHDP